MYNLLFHVLALAILEIIFYFEYIGPMETKLFKDSFLGIIDSLINSINESKIDNIKLLLENQFVGQIIYEIIFGNESIKEYENKLLKNMESAVKKRNNFNFNIYSTCLTYWSIITIFVIISYFILKRIKRYYDNKNEYIIEECSSQPIPSLESNNSIELIDRSSVNPMELIRIRTDSTESDDSNIQDERNKIESWLPKKWKYYIVYYILLSGLILLFEYLFFNDVVMEYKILSNDEVKYYSYNKLKPWIISTFIY
tara:strand:- start:181 stop:945 length:765 start_codon:yes stop_codon:yes gene_type:complete